jgi:hypothetical protein
MPHAANDSARLSFSSHPARPSRPGDPSRHAAPRFRWLFLLLLCLTIGCQSTLRTTPFCRPVPKPNPPVCCPVVPPTTTFESQSPLNWGKDSSRPSAPSLLDTWKTSNPPEHQVPAIGTDSPGKTPSPNAVCNAVPLLELTWRPGSIGRALTPSASSIIF